VAVLVTTDERLPGQLAHRGEHALVGDRSPAQLRGDHLCTCRGARRGRATGTPNQAHDPRIRPPSRHPGTRPGISRRRRSVRVRRETRGVAGYGLEEGAAETDGAALGDGAAPGDGAVLTDGVAEDVGAAVGVGLGVGLGVRMPPLPRISP
jgi:hypothetical protein